MIIREFKKDDYVISTDKRKLQLEVIHEFLSKSYWAENIPIDIVKKSIENSFCFGLYQNEHQIGFARLITDFTTFAYLADVFILDEHRGKGLSKWLMKVMVDYPELKGLRGWMLKTLDAHGLYKKFGFDKPRFPERVMEYSPLRNGYKHNPET
jgi:GNAT superfamily N-acetyltransferase